jgi:hypothetical protein
MQEDATALRSKTLPTTKNSRGILQLPGDPEETVDHALALSFTPGVRAG